jgi:NADP-dependent 3-hydroxy acid dehydrogenase YdfG
MDGEGDIVDDTRNALRVRVFFGQPARLDQRFRNGGGLFRHSRMVAPGVTGNARSAREVRMTELPLRGKTALITGASAGIGRATAVALANSGANVVVTARREERLRELCASIEMRGGRAVFHAGDAADEATAQAAVGLAVETFGALDILINNAGVGNYKNLVDTSAAEYDAMMDANMRSGFLFVSSIAGIQGVAGEAVYCATKFAQVGFSQALDAELRKHNIKVGVICPGGVKSEFALGHGRTEESIRASRMMEPEEVADAIVFACLQPANVRIPQMMVRHMG